MKRIFSKKSDIKDKAYPICTESIGGKEGTNERSEWDDDAKDRYDRCLDHVSDEKDMKDPCWKGYEQIGMKDKGGKEVPNCVPKKSSSYFSIFKSAQEGQQYDLQDDGLAEKMQRFETLVKNHDLTYQYSDDPTSHNRGRQSYSQILELAKELPRDDAVRIWNSYVEKKLTPGSQQAFLWQ